MKKCIKCTSDIDDKAIFCHVCGTEQPQHVLTKFCPTCGKELYDNANVCDVCGYNFSLNSIYLKNRNTPVIVKKLIAGLISTSVLWLCIGGSQLLCFLLLASYVIFVDYNSNFIFAIFCYLLFGITNVVAGITDIIKAAKLKKDYIGIVRKYSFMNAIGLYIWNGVIIIGLIANMNCICFFFAFMGLSALAVDFICVRLYTYKNRIGLFALEKSQIGMQ